MRLLSFLLLLCAANLTAQRPVQLRIHATGCRTAPAVYTFNGAGFSVTDSLSQLSPDTYGGALSLDAAAFRYVGTAANDLLPVIVGAEDTLTVTGACGRFRQAAVSGSPVNRAYTALKQRFDANHETYQTLQQDIEVVRDARVNAEGRRMMRALDAEKEALVEEMAASSPLLGRIAALNTYLSFYSADSTAFTGPADHFARTYFRFVDFSDPGYNELSWTYEAARTYASTLAQSNPRADLADRLLEATGRWPAGSHARFLARSGALSSLLSIKHPAAGPVAEATFREYADLYPEPVTVLRRQADALRSFLVGVEAPLFSGVTPEGDSLSLESLRGQYVLLDFWASWCGPCRRENPNVVKLYDRYHGAGFEILGISLDDRRERWLKAIADDKLTWPHVSDLQGWRSAHAQLYGVTSIPQTVLLDPDGNIVARNLRGAALERKLRELLGAR